MASGRHANSISAAELTSGLAPDGIYIAAIGSYSPDPNKVNRYTLYREKRDAIEACADAWLAVACSVRLSIAPTFQMRICAETMPVSDEHIRMLVNCARQHAGIVAAFNFKHNALNAAH